MTPITNNTTSLQEVLNTLNEYEDALPLSGGTLTGPLTLASDPVNNMDASTKKYVDNQIDSHGTHVTFSTTAPNVAGTASVGSATTVSRSDHVHPAQTTITGNAATATKLQASKTIRTNLASTSTASFDGSANITPGVNGTLSVANGGTGQTSIIDTEYTTPRYRASALVSSEPTLTENGVIYWMWE